LFLQNTDRPAWRKYVESNLLITGMPGCGKTTLIKEIISETGLACAGFFTEEIRERGTRRGFQIEFINGVSGILARKGLKSKYKLGAYGVDIEGFNASLEKENLNIMNSRCVIIDEIGKMELFSEKFKGLIYALLERDSLLLATIMYKPHPFADRIKQRKDVRMFNLERTSFPAVKKQIIEILKEYIP
jgi:nucleoside-triphosphatase